jgi:hypothetical protein
LSLAVQAPSQHRSAADESLWKLASTGESSQEVAMSAVANDSSGADAGWHDRATRPERLAQSAAIIIHPRRPRPSSTASRTAEKRSSGLVLRAES